jgi:hypothetical protein
VGCFDAAILSTEPVLTKTDLLAEPVLTKTDLLAEPVLTKTDLLAEPVLTKTDLLAKSEMEPTADEFPGTHSVESKLNPSEIFRLRFSNHLTLRNSTFARSIADLLSI